MPESGECLRQKKKILEVKKYEETMTNEPSQNRRREYQIDEITYAKGITLNEYICVQGMKGRGGRGVGLKIRS